MSLYENYITVIYPLGSAREKNALCIGRAPTSHSVTDPAEFNAVCRSKPNLPKRTDSDAALLPYLAHQLGSAHEWSDVWNGPLLTAARTVGSAAVCKRRASALPWCVSPRAEKGRVLVCP